MQLNRLQTGEHQHGCTNLNMASDPRDKMSVVISIASKTGKLIWVVVLSRCCSDRVLSGQSLLNFEFILFRGLVEQFQDLTTLRKLEIPTLSRLRDRRKPP